MGGGPVKAGYSGHGSFPSRFATMGLLHDRPWSNIGPWFLCVPRLSPFLLSL